MNIAREARLTAAETALIDAYTAALGSLPGDGAVTIARDRLLDDLKQAGLPTRRVEAWHYTDLKALLKTVPPAIGDSMVTDAEPLVAGAAVLPLRHGASVSTGDVSGLAVARYNALLLNGAAAERLPARGSDDAIGRINGAFVTDGYALTVGPDVTLAQIVELQASHGAGQIHSRFPATFSAGSRATVIERHLSVSPEAALVSAVSDLTLESGAEITWIILQQQGDSDTHLGQIKVTLGENAKLRLFIINAGGKLVRQEVHVVTAGGGADFTLRAINLLGGDTHTDVTMTLGHDVPDTTSTEIIRNVVFDRAKGVFQGQIRVAPDAQKTDARMACNTLLMSDDADFSVKPELEIFADDVQCAHGATVADIDHNHLYYLMARGIPASRARGLLINAFVAEIVEELDDEALVEALEGVIADWLENHG